MKPLVKLSASPEIWSGKNYVITKTYNGIITESQYNGYYLAARAGKVSGAYSTFEEAVQAEEAKEGPADDNT